MIDSKSHDWLLQLPSSSSTRTRSYKAGSELRFTSKRPSSTCDDDAGGVATTDSFASVGTRFAPTPDADGQEEEPRGIVASPWRCPPPPLAESSCEPRCSPLPSLAPPSVDFSDANAPPRRRAATATVVVGAAAAVVVFGAAVVVFDDAVVAFDVSSGERPRITRCRTIQVSWPPASMTSSITEASDAWPKSRAASVGDWPAALRRSGRAPSRSSHIAAPPWPWYAAKNSGADPSWSGASMSTPCRFSHSITTIEPEMAAYLTRRQHVTFFSQPDEKSGWRYVVDTGRAVEKEARWSTHET